MSNCWADLNNCLRLMKPIGEHGFEGLMAKLLSCLFNEQYVVARSGRQVSGDARNISGTISIQAKRYSQVTPLNLNDIEGSIIESIRSMPELETYVICCTKRIDAEFQDRINKIQEEKGIDIIIIQYTGEFSELGALCIRYWKQINDFTGLTELNNMCKEWIVSLIEDPRTSKIVDDLRDRIKIGVTNREELQKKCVDFINKRFNLKSQTSINFIYDIDLNESINRKKYILQLTNAFFEDKPNICSLEGDEGTGKSWLAAQYVKKISDDGYITFWLDSVNWNELKSLDEIIRYCLGRFCFDKLTIEKLSRKIHKTWNNSVIIVLDGVNERNSLFTANKILRDYCDQWNESQIKVLFTTRSLELYPNYEKNLWKICKKIKVNPYDDQEFQEALSKLGITENLNKLDNSLLDLLKIPRYLTVSYSLIDKLKSAKNLTKEIILWEELKHKIENADSQVKMKMGWQTICDAETVLSGLAKNVVWTSEIEGPILSANEVKNFIGEYSQIRTDLKELKIANKTNPISFIVDKGHIKLGWALYLCKYLESSIQINIHEFADEFRRILEPIPSEDLRTEALYLALLLSFYQNYNENNLSLRRASLMIAWLRSHNPNITAQRLSLLSELDVFAYCLMIEILFELQYYSEFETALIIPIARMWRLNNNNSNVIRDFLKKWFLLTLSPNDKPEEKEVEYEGIKLPIANNESQLRLTAVAISIVSLRTETGLLRELAICYESRLRSKGIGYQNNIFEIKEVGHNIAVLMRWCYTEKAIPHFKKLIDDNPNRIVINGIKGLTYLLWLNHVPKILKGEKEKSRFYNFRSFRENLQHKHRILSDDEPEDYLKSRHLSGLAELAAREDMPAIKSKDIQQIRKYFNYVSTHENILSSKYLSPSDNNFQDLLPWAARFNFSELKTIFADLLKKSFLYENPRFLYIIIRDFFNKNNSKCITKTILDNKEKIINFKEDDFATDNPEYIPYLLTQIILFNSNRSQFFEWLEFLSRDHNYRTAIYIVPMSFLLRCFSYPNLRDLAYKRIKLIKPNTHFVEEDKPNLTEFEYWSIIYADSANGSKKTISWFTNRLLDNIFNAKLFVPFTKIFTQLASSKLINDIILRKNFIKRLGNDNCKRFFISVILQRNIKFTLDRSFKFHLKKYGLNLSGCIFYLNNKNIELDRWANEVCNLALNLLTKPHFNISIKNDIILDENGTIDSVFHRSDGKHSVFTGYTASSWGIQTKDRLKDFIDTKKIDKHDKLEFKNWKTERSHYLKWEGYEIGEFLARKPFEAWALKNKEKFKKFSIQYLDRLIGNQQHVDCLSLFTDSVICTLANIDPVLTYFYYNKLKPYTNISIYNEFYVPSFINAMFSRNMTGENTSQIRFKLFDNCLDDESIMFVTLGFLSTYSEKEIIDFVINNYINCPLAKQRCLGISILSWIGNTKSIKILNKLNNSDNSFWVRTFCKWAIDVSMTERSCRRIYKKSLLTNDLDYISTKLIQIKPVLTPLARWWRKKIEAQVNFNIKCKNRKIKAFIEMFWYHWGSSSTSHRNIKVCDRSLEDYCRGERLDFAVTPRLSPWWKVNI